MSWILTVPASPRDELIPNAHVMYEEYVAERDPDDETRSQIEAAISAVATIVGAGAVGDGRLTASLGGHANRGHVTPDGVAADTVSISVSAVVER